MTTLVRSIVIEAGTPDIEAVALDPQRIAEWYVGIERMQLDDLFPEPGGCGKFVLRIAGAALTVDVISEELVRGERFVYRIEGMLDGVWRWTSTPEAGGTRLTVTAGYKPADGVFGDLADSLIVERRMVEDLEKSLQRLAALAETEREIQAHSMLAWS